MKTSFFTLLTFLLLTTVQVSGQIPDVDGAAVVPAPAATYKPARKISMSPDSKRALALKASERNPYAKRSPGREELDENGENQEEVQIRSTLSSLSVSGQSRGRNGLRILLGDIIIEQGQILPVLIPDQSENLKVVEVTEETVTLAWLDIETNEPTGKTLQLTYDLSPSVSYALHGQGRIDPTAAEDGTQIVQRTMGVLRIGRERKKHQARMAAKDPGRDLPREVYEAAQ